MGSTEAECEVFRLKRVNLILDKEVKNSSAVCICIVDYVASCVLNGVLERASVSGVLILNIRKTCTKVTATVSNLTRNAVEASLYIVAKVANRITYTIKALKHRSVYAVKALTKSLLNCRLSELNVVEVAENCGIVEACRKVSLCCTRRTATTTRATASASVNYDRLGITLTSATAKATAVIVAKTAVSKCEEQKYNPKFVIVKAFYPLLLMLTIRISSAYLFSYRENLGNCCGLVGELYLFIAYALPLTILCIAFGSD